MPKKDIYCGKSRKIPDEYKRHGTKYECLKRGFGAGMYSQIKNIPIKSKKTKKEQLRDTFNTLAMLLKINQ